DPAAIQRDEIDSADLYAGRDFTRQPSVRRVLARVRAADLSGRRRRRPIGVHPRARLLHHAGAAGRPERADGQLLRRLFHQPHHQLGHGLRARRLAVCGDPGVVYGVPAFCQNRREHGINAMKSLPLFPPYVSLTERIWFFLLRGFNVLVLVFLVLPILVIIPLSFSDSSFLSYPMPGLSLRWYDNLIHSE